MKRLVLTIILIVVLTSTVQARSRVSYRVPTIRTSYTRLRLPSSRDKNVQILQTVGVIGTELYKTNVADRHGNRAINTAQMDRKLEHEEIMAQQRARQEAERQKMYETAARLKAEQEAKEQAEENKRLQTEIEQLRLEVERLRLELEMKRLREKLEEQ